MGIAREEAKEREAGHVFQPGGRSRTDGRRGRLYDGKDGTHADDLRFCGLDAQGGAGVFFPGKVSFDAQLDEFLLCVSCVEVAVAVFEGGLRLLGGEVGLAGFFLQFLRVGQFFALLAGSVFGDMPADAAVQAVEYGGRDKRVLHPAGEDHRAGLAVGQDGDALPQFVDELVGREGEEAALAFLQVFAKGEDAVRRAIGGLHGQVEQGSEEGGRKENVGIEAGLQCLVARRAFESTPRRQAVQALVVGDCDAFGGGQGLGLVFLGEDEGNEEAEKKAGGGGFEQESPMLPDCAPVEGEVYSCF